uniref:Uncharacterized protein n=1 Tax=Candidatus Kentrum sp. SD TaxID=2126332 RepID=A0A450YF33_9GAMM|nr:MAG: hypothetical protein BECKSD772F_GA0070984_105418 [Candidatus Kentron sp. SD]VFK45484.1 MAG: hypothetical protein BECKSD772E_GA0070983_105418 [Candidatus Kentron sp. SD]
MDTTSPCKQPEGEKARLAISMTVVFGGQRVPGEDRFRVGKVDAVLRQVCPALFLMPNEHGKILALFGVEVMPMSGNLTRSPCPTVENGSSYATP